MGLRKYISKLKNLSILHLISNAKLYHINCLLFCIPIDLMHQKKNLSKNNQFKNKINYLDKIV